MSCPKRASIAVLLVAGAVALSFTHIASAQDSARAQQVPAAQTATRAPPSHSGTPNASAVTAIVDQPRGTGYFVGDKMIQRVLLERAGQPVSPVSLSAPGRVSAWFERRTASIQTDPSSHRWLVIEYQILNAPPKQLTVKLPAWSLSIKGAGPRPPGSGASQTMSGAPAALPIPAASINIAPLSPPGTPTQVGTADLRPDRLPPAIAMAPIWRSIEEAVGGVCLTLTAWLGWITWRNRRARATQPFARALREMGALDDGEPSAWQALPSAFGQTAGRVLHP